jgi:hypothetical protein
METNEQFLDRAHAAIMGVMLASSTDWAMLGKQEMIAQIVKESGMRLSTVESVIERNKDRDFF